MAGTVLGELEKEFYGKKKDELYQWTLKNPIFSYHMCLKNCNSDDFAKISNITSLYITIKNYKALQLHAFIALVQYITFARGTARHHPPHC